MRNEIGKRVTEATDGRHDARSETPLYRRAAARKLAIIMGGLGEAHGNTRADGSRETDQEGLPGILRGEGGREDRRERRDRAIHQASKARLHVGQQKLAFCGFSLFGLAICIEMFLFQHMRHVFVAPLRLSQITEQLARRGIGGALDRFIVEPDRLRFHQFGLGANFL